jgi:hypothetical protein
MFRAALATRWRTHATTENLDILVGVSLSLLAAIHGEDRRIEGEGLRRAGRAQLPQPEPLHEAVQQKQSAEVGQRLAREGNLHLAGARTAHRQNLTFGEVLTHGPLLLPELPENATETLEAASVHRITLVGSPTATLSAGNASRAPRIKATARNVTFPITASSGLNV